MKYGSEGGLTKAWLIVVRPPIEKKIETKKKRNNLTKETNKTYFHIHLRMHINSYLKAYTNKHKYKPYSYEGLRMSFQLKFSSIVTSKSLCEVTGGVYLLFQILF